jgi:cell division protein FtsI (penicillin-binding protein 3)
MRSNSAQNSPKNSLLSSIWRLVWPSRPDPDKSRRVARARLLVAGLIASSCFMGISAKAVWLTTGHDSAKSGHSQNNSAKMRGAIYDRKGRLLASTLPIMTLHLDPKLVLNPFEVAEKLAPLVPSMSEQDILTALKRKSRYIELDRKITPTRHAAILSLGLPGVFVSQSALRSYPQGSEAAHVLGQVDIDGNGIAGIEKSMNDQLASGRDVHLSIDVAVQAVVRQSLGNQIKRFEAIGGAGLIMDMKTGELISLVSLPDYDPNQYRLADETARFNQATKGVFEMGSIFKVLNTAIALESGAAALGSSYDVSKPMRISGWPISDYHPLNRSMNLSEVLVYSSNIGSAQIAEAIGADIQQSYMKKLGLLNRPSLALPETAQPLYPRNWGRLSTITISYGYGLSVSPVHIAGAIAAAAGNGEFIAPTLRLRQEGELFERTRIFSPETTKKVRSMMRLVVAHEEGTANYADAPGYLVGAKTGSAEKLKKAARGYNKKANRTSVVAAFPIHDPRYLVFVMVDEPKPQKFSHGFATAGWVAAPVISEIVTNAAPILGVLPMDMKAPEIRQNLSPNLNIDGKGAIFVSY